MKKETKKVYKTNKKLLKKVLIGILLIFIVTFLAVPIKNGVELLYLKSWKWHEISEYEFSVKLPRAYKDISISDKKNALNAAAFLTESSVEIEEKYVYQEPEIVYNGGNILNGVSLMIQCLETEKTTRTLDDIADSHYTLIKIHYDDKYKIGELKKEYVKVLGSEAIKTIVDISKKDDEETFVTYLVPMDEKEITITFLGTKENINNSMDEIEKIISQMK